jgi:hypothetical protein
LAKGEKAGSVERKVCVQRVTAVVWRWEAVNREDEGERFVAEWLLRLEGSVWGRKIPAGGGSFLWPKWGRRLGWRDRFFRVSCGFWVSL